MGLAYLCLLTALHLASCLAARSPSEIGSPCGAELGDCAGALHCVPLSSNCTQFTTCPGTCGDLDSSPQQIYTLCGGWELMDDCDERVEICVADPRHKPSCGPSCDDMGICAMKNELCGGDYDLECPSDKACFGGDRADWDTNWPPRLCNYDDSFPNGLKCGGYCFPLRFGSDEYKKSREWEVIRTDQDGYQEDEKA